jgi:hypothetical protein
LEFWAAEVVQWYVPRGRNYWRPGTLDSLPDPIVDLSDIREVAPMRMHTRWALDHGCTPAELDALATLLAIYTGFARASYRLMIIRDELKKLEAH